jgi:5-(carboxyamino)imidazole ribonucleotide synthase
VAPRPHNSGHLTIEACQASQFEQQVRVVCGLPLGDTGLLFPVAAMVNLMGELWSEGEPDWNAVLASPASHLHLYGKRHAATGRKMGHITGTGIDRQSVVDRLLAVREKLTTRV